MSDNASVMFQDCFWTIADPLSYLWNAYSLLKAVSNECMPRVVLGAITLYLALFDQLSNYTVMRVLSFPVMSPFPGVLDEVSGVNLPTPLSRKYQGFRVSVLRFDGFQQFL